MRQFSSIQKCAGHFANDMIAHLNRAIDERDQASLAVSGGGTPKHLFPVLSQADLDWGKVTITLIDERWVEPDHPDSNEDLAKRLLLKGGASKATFVGLKTTEADPFDGLAEVEARLSRLSWPLDVAYLGMGEDGHIASLFPDDPSWQTAAGRAHAVPSLANRQPRMSLSPTALLDCRHLYLVISGPEKRAVLEAAMKPGPVEELPVRIILHQDQVPVEIYVVD